MKKFAHSANFIIMLEPTPQHWFISDEYFTIADARKYTRDLMLVKCERAPPFCARNNSFSMVAYRAGFFTCKTSSRAPTFILYLVRTKNLCIKQDLGNGSCDFLEPILFWKLRQIQDFWDRCQVDWKLGSREIRAWKFSARENMDQKTKTRYQRGSNLETKNGWQTYVPLH